MAAVDKLREYTIAYSGLKDGSHAFAFDLDPAFFEAAADEEMPAGDMHVDVELEKSATMLVANIHAMGVLHTTCDHCNAPLELPLEGRQRQVFHLTGRQWEAGNENDEVVGLEPTDTEVDLTHYIYECMRLALPLRHAHAPGHCDPEVERALGALNTEHEPVPDPRWNVLDQLKNTEE